MCHQVALSSIKVEIAADETQSALVVTARANTSGQTGVEMEALTAVSVACLTIYDMLKASDRAMVIEGITLLEKHGGASGDYIRRASAAVKPAFTKIACASGPSRKARKPCAGGDAVLVSATG